MDGVIGAAWWWGSWLVRCQFLSDETRERLGAAVQVRRQRRVSAETPVSFAGLELMVADGVFKPNIATERVLDLGVASVADVQGPIVLDIGTGSGALALAVAQRVPSANVLGMDLDPVSVACADANARRLGVHNVAFVRGSLLESVPAELGRVDLILANLPYVPGVVAASGDWHAPMHTVRGLHFDGLGLLRDLVGQAKARLRAGGYLVMQLVDWQWDAWQQELLEQGFTPIGEVSRFPGRPVVAAARWEG
jgi:release factor glutamine methyltransferase